MQGVMMMYVWDCLEWVAILMAMLVIVMVFLPGGGADATTDGGAADVTWFRVDGLGVRVMTKCLMLNVTL